MASEEHVDVSVRLPPDLEEWLDQQAADTERSREDVMREIVAAYRSVAEDGTSSVLTEDDVEGYATQDALDDLEERVAEEESTLSELADRVADDEAALDDYREAVEEQLDDVRKRVVQVKRGADAKAAADHEHDELAERLDAVEDDLVDVRSAVADVEDDLDAGFENFEDVLEYLTDTTDDLNAKTGTLARVLVDLRSEVKRLSARASRRAEVEALQLAANREGVKRANCGECESSVDVSLLTEPECPNCASTFGDVEKRSGIFSSNRLVTGDPPALPAGHDEDLDEALAEELAEHVEGEER